jgi:aarF domain-containing kinase
MLRPPLLLHRPQCLRLRPSLFRTFTSRPGQPLTSIFRPNPPLPLPSTPSNPQPKKVRKSKPLHISPSPSAPFRRRRRLILYALAFLGSAGVTFSVLQPDNVVNHVFHGIVRCGRVSFALVQCVVDYRIVMRKKYGSEEERTKKMGETHTRCAKRALGVFEKNGGIYIKLGQHLAALSYLIPIVLSHPPTDSGNARNG